MPCILRSRRRKSVSKGHLASSTRWSRQGLKAFTTVHRMFRTVVQTLAVCKVHVSGRSSRGQLTTSLVRSIPKKRKLDTYHNLIKAVALHAGTLQCEPPCRHMNVDVQRPTWLLVSSCLTLRLSSPYPRPRLPGINPCVNGANKVLN